MNVKEFGYVLAFDIGDKVQYKNKIGKDEGFVTGISIRQYSLVYGVTWSDKGESFHCDFELLLID